MRLGNRGTKKKRPKVKNKICLNFVKTIKLANMKTKNYELKSLKRLCMTLMRPVLMQKMSYDYKQNNKNRKFRKSIKFEEKTALKQLKP